MASDDFSGVTAAFNKASYVAGEVMTVTVTGQNRHTSDPSTTQETVTLSLSLRSDSGATTTIPAAPVSVTHSTPGGVTLENVVIVSVTDSGGRVWTVQAGGHTATAVA